jgi:hypothetical protein
LWIYGPASSGKTYHIEQLIDYGIKTYQMPYNDDWTGFDPTFHEIVYADEFIGQVTIQKLNSLCDRNTRLNAKYGGVIKSNKVLVIVLSNFTIA